MSLRGNNKCIVDSAMAVVHRHVFRFRGIVNAGRARTQLFSLTDSPESDTGSNGPRGSSGSAS